MADDAEIIRARVNASFASIQRDLENLNRKAKEVTDSGGGLGQFDGILGRLTRGMIGTTGLVAGLYQVGKALENVAASSVGLQMMSRNANLATEDVSRLQQAFRRLGMSTGEADNTITTLTSKLNNLQAFKEASEIFQTLSKAEGGAAIASQLKAMVETGDQMGAINKIFEVFQRQTEAGKIAWAQYWGVSVAAMEKGPDAIKKNIDALKLNREEAERYHNMWVDFEVKFGGLWKKIAGHGIEGVNTITEHLRSQGLSAKSIADSVNAETDSVLAKIKATIDEIKTIKDSIDAISGDDPAKGKEGAQKLFGMIPLPGEGKQPFGSWADFLNLTPYEAFTGERFGEQPKPFTPDRYRGRGSQPLGGFKDKRSDLGTHSGITDFSGMRRTESIEEQQTSTLTDIRDILKRIEEGRGGSGGGGISLPGGGRGMLGERLGMYSGGGTPGVGPTSVGKGGDPRGMEGYIREAARARGIDPDTAVAVAKSEGLRTFLGDNGKSGGAFQLYTGGGLGNEFQKKTGLDPLDPANEKATIDFALDHAAKHGWGAFHGAKNTGIGPRAGIGGVTPAPGDGKISASTFGGTVLERQGRVAGVRKGPLDPQLRTALDYASANSGLTVDVTSGGQRMHGAPGAVGSHRHDFGRAADFNLRDANGNIVSPNDPRAIEFYRYAAQAGVTGGGEGYMSDPNKIHLDRAGGIYAGSRAFREALMRGQNESAQFEAARRAMDGRKQSVWDGKVSAEVKFLNVPPNVSTNVDTSGSPFHELQVSKSRQNEVAGGTTGQPFAGVW
ncbi:hypothetical protein IVA95_16230 [Bradyrhizobium sp. 157]|uniref:hypothetical protein n=1 Tax=Bradyrhizobium sp. 157 TaxID=2782631 RepID=UPI001FFACE9F|nr:hypothetical protein [Bradyrhizobium sp. 157]MCK1639109.1 hypothetical protein [Bradyrhizobium sp. 157]